MGTLKVKVGTIYERITRGPKGDPGADGAIVGESKIFNGIALPSGYLWEDGSAVSRTTYAALFAAITLTVSGNNLGGNPNITGLASTTGIRTGFFVSGPGVPAGATVTAVNPDSITLSAATTGGSTGGQYVIAPHGVGDGMTTFNLPDKRLRVPVGAGATSKALGANEGVAEATRNDRWSHTHGHSASMSGAVAGNPANISIAAADTNHNHTGPADHGTGGAASGSGVTRLGPAPGHGSTGLAVQAGGQSHNHGLTDSWHGHGLGTLAATVADGGSSDHPYVAVNYIIKF